MAKIIGNTTATPNPRPDWEQTDVTKADYIKNKPEIIGKKTADGGEIFNDYEDNRAISPYSTAIGTNTLVGCKGLVVSSFDLLNDNESVTNQKDAIVTKIKFTLSDAEELNDCLSTWTNKDYVSIDANHKLSRFGTIIEKSIDEKFVIVDLVDKTVKVEQSDGNGWKNRLTTTDVKVLYNITRPEAGYNDIHVYSATAAGLGSVALLQGSHSFGRDNRAEGRYSFAVGRGNRAGYAAVAEGYLTAADGEYSHTEGYKTKTFKRHGHAEGNLSQALGANSHAQNFDTRANGDNSHAEGEGSIANGTHSHAGGYSSKADGNVSFAHGQGNTSFGQRSVTFGLNTGAYGEDSFAVGSSTTKAEDEIYITGTKEPKSNSELLYIWKTKQKFSLAKGKATFVYGNDSLALGDKSLAGGDSSIAEGICSVAIGLNTQAIAPYSLSFGNNTVTKGQASTAFGEKTTTIGDRAFISGQSTNKAIDKIRNEDGTIKTTSEINSAWGTAKFSLALGEASSIFGRDSLALGAQSFAAGFQVRAQGDYSIATGKDSNASGNNAFAGGASTIAKGTASLAFGSGSSAYGNQSIALGQNTSACGNRSFAAGASGNKAIYYLQDDATQQINQWKNQKFALAKGEASTVFGTNCMTLKANSFAAGSMLLAKNENQAVFGSYNSYTSSSALFTVGNGASDTNRSNAFEVYTDGRAELQTQGETENSVVIKSHLDKNINALDNVLVDILAAIQLNKSDAETIDAIEQTIVSYLETKTVVEVEE